MAIVSQRDFVNLPSVEERKVWWSRVGNRKCPNHKAIVCPTTNQVYSVPTRRYKLVTHQQAISLLEDVLEEVFPGRGYTDPGRLVGNEYRGHYLLTNVDNFARMRLAVNIHPYSTEDFALVMYNSYDLGWKFKIRLCGYSPGGATIPTWTGYYSKLHVQGLSLEKVKAWLEEAIGSFVRDREEQFNRSLSALEIKEAFEDLDFSKTLSEYILTVAPGPGYAPVPLSYFVEESDERLTMYSFISRVTEALVSAKISENMRMVYEDRLADIFN